jgi:cullin 4
MKRPDYDPEFEKGEEMFKDLTLSREFTADFHDARGHTGLSVFVLQYSAWPITRRKPGEKTVPLPLNVRSY